MINLATASKLKEFLYRDPLDDDIVILRRFCLSEDVEKVLLNRKPSLLIEKAVVINTNDDTTNIVAGMHVLSDYCSGHYPKCPFLSLSHQLEFIGQTGALLLSVTYKESFVGSVPLVCGSKEMRWGTSGFILPGTDLFAIGEVTFCRFGFAKVDVMITDGNDVVLTVEDVTFRAFKIAELERIGRENGKEDEDH